MLFCPLMCYGNAREHDMDFGQFCIMFRSIFLEGFARPAAGVRLILKHLVRQVPRARRRTEAAHRRVANRVENGRVVGVVLDNDELSRPQVSPPPAGRNDTPLRSRPSGRTSRAAGQLSFRETIASSMAAPRPGLRTHDHVLQRSDKFCGKSPTNCATCAAA